MHIERFRDLRNYIALTPAELIIMSDRQYPGTAQSLAAYVADLAADEDLPTPSPALYLDLTFDEARNLFLMYPDEVCGGELEMDACGFVKRKIFDTYQPETRKAIILRLLDTIIETGIIDWRAAKAHCDVEVAA